LRVLGFHRDVLLSRIPLMERLIDHLASILTRMPLNKAVYSLEQFRI
jgi:hypothetical protein